MDTCSRGVNLQTVRKSGSCEHGGSCAIECRFSATPNNQASYGDRSDWFISTLGAAVAINSGYEGLTDAVMTAQQKGVEVDGLAFIATVNSRLQNSGR